MKIKILVAFIATATFIFLSCNWFRSKKEISNPLVGDWQVDSFYSGKDTSIAAFLMVAAMSDTGGVKVSFTNDSVFTKTKSAIDTVAYTFDVHTKLLNIKDSVNQPLVFTKLNDSLITLTTKDSAILFLQKN
jgi:hypothetical protein